MTEDKQERDSRLVVQWGWRLRTPASKGRPAGPWHWQLEEPTGSTAEFSEYQPVWVDADD